MTWQAAREDRWLSRLTVTGEPGKLAGGSKRRRYTVRLVILLQGKKGSPAESVGEQMVQMA